MSTEASCTEAIPHGKEGFWKRRFVAPILQQLRQGATPEKIAFTIALGLTLCIFPILGATTLLCAAAGMIFRLNQPIIQLVNYIAYPLQIALLLPFYRAGESLFGRSHTPLSIGMLLERFHADPKLFLKNFGMIGVQGIVVWLIAAPFLIAACYLAFRPLLRLAAKRASLPCS